MENNCKELSLLLHKLDYPIMAQHARKCDEKMKKIYQNFIQYVVNHRSKQGELTL